MRILTLYNRVPYPLRDGGALAVYGMLEMLRAKGHQVDLLCLNPSRNFINSSDIPDQLFQYYHLQTLIVNTDINQADAFLNLFTNKPYHTSRFYHPGFKKLLEARLREKHYDLIVLEAPFMGVYLNDIRQLTLCPVVLRAHNVDHLIWQRIAAGTRSFFKKKYLQLQASRLKKFELTLAAAVDALVPISSVDAAYFKDQGIIGPIFCSPMGIKLPESAIPEQTKCRQLGFIGTLDWMPNLEGMYWFINHCWPLVHAKVPKLQFHLAGRKIPIDIQSIHGDGIVVFGEVPDASAFMSSLQLFVVPLHSGSGIRIKLLEAMAMGLPIISTTIGAEGIPVVNGTHMLLADTAEEFAGAIQLIAKDPAFGYQLGRHARELIAEQYNIEKTGRELSAFYRDLVHA